MGNEGRGHMKTYTVYRNTFYFASYADAERVCNNLKQTYPEARIVEYERGYAIQREKSGPYWGNGSSFGLVGWH